MPGQNLTDRDELAGIIGSIHHKRNQRLHAIEAGDLSASAVVVRAHADAHVQPFVAVYKVVTTVTNNDVAAVAAQDDVAAAERSYAGAEEVLQTADQIDIGEHAPLGSDVGDHR